MLTRDVSVARHFAGLPDPRVDRSKKHALGDILVIALCALSRVHIASIRFRSWRMPASAWPA